MKFQRGCTNTPFKIIASNKYQHKGSSFSSRPGGVSVLFNNKSIPLKGADTILELHLLMLDTYG